jgi:hypothetical protein
MEPGALSYRKEAIEDYLGVYGLRRRGSETR